MADKAMVSKDLLGDPSPQPSIVRVALPAAAYYDLGKFQKIQKDILGRLGCPGCTSGHHIHWDIYRNFIVDEKLNVNPAAFGGGRFG